MIISFWIAVSTIKDAVKYLASWKTEIQHVIPEQIELSQPFSPLTGEQGEAERSGIEKDAEMSGAQIQAEKSGDQIQAEKSGDQDEAKKSGNTGTHLLEHMGDKVTFCYSICCRERLSFK